MNWEQQVQLVAQLLIDMKTPSYHADAIRLAEAIVEALHDVGICTDPPDNLTIMEGGRA